MIDLLKAKETVEKSHPELIITSIGEIEHGWIFSFGDGNGNYLKISPVYVSKDTGIIEPFFPPSHLKELKGFKKIM